MKTLLFLLLSTTVAFSQRSVTLLPAYVNAEPKEFQRLIEDNARKNPLPETVKLFKDYPVLLTLDKFNKKAKYSFINEALLSGDPIYTNKGIIFPLKNGVQYKVKDKKRLLLPHTLKNTTFR